METFWMIYFFGMGMSFGLVVANLLMYRIDRKYPRTNLKKYQAFMYNAVKICSHAWQLERAMQSIECGIHTSETRSDESWCLLLKFLEDERILIDRREIVENLNAMGFNNLPAPGSYESRNLQ